MSSTRLAHLVEFPVALPIFRVSACPEMRTDDVTGLQRAVLRDDHNDRMVRDVMQRLKWFEFTHCVIETRTQRWFSTFLVRDAWGTPGLNTQVEELPWRRAPLITLAV